MKISIITTIYKAEKDLPRLLDSMMAQKSDELEFFLIDNGSPDNCGEICKEYAKRDSRFVICTLKDNIGYIRARNYGIEHCDGDYIGFCDSDDYLEAGAYDNAVEVLKSTDCDLYLTSYKTIRGDSITENKLPYETGLYQGERVSKIILPQAFGRLKNRGLLHGFAWKQIFKREIIVNNNISFFEPLKPYEDQLFNVDVIGKCNSVYVDDNLIYNYIVNVESITAKLACNFNAKEEFDRIFLLYSEKENRVKNITQHTANCNAILTMIYSCILNIVKQGSTVKNCVSEIKQDANSQQLKKVLSGASNNIGIINFIVKILLQLKCYGCLVVLIRALLKLRHT